MPRVRNDVYRRTGVSVSLNPKPGGRQTHQRGGDWARGEARVMMNTLSKTVLASVGLGAVLTLLSAAAWGDAIVTVPEPTGDPSAENQYN